MNYKKILEELRVSSCMFSTSGSSVNENFYYFTGASKSTQVTGTVIVHKNGLVILTNRLEYKILSGKGKLIIVETRKDVENVLKKYCGSIVGVDFSSTSVERFNRIKKMLKDRKLIDVSGKIEKIRSVKSSHEIKNIKEACKITEEVLSGMEKIIKKCTTEKDVAIELEYASRKNGAEAIAYPPIVAFGVNSALPHHVPGKTKISKGLLLVDFGVVYDGYCSDLTRMFTVGRASAEVKNVYAVVYAAQQAAISEVRANAKASSVHVAANKILFTGLKQKLIHSIGHGLGIAVHDCFAVSDRSNFTLKNGMVITVEPGYYGKFGLRIEDDILVSKRAKLLSKAPAEITEI